MKNTISIVRQARRLIGIIKNNSALERRICRAGGRNHMLEQVSIGALKTS